MSQHGIAEAVEHHRAGRLEDAERLYRAILATEPGNVDALHLLGVIAHQVGREDAAVDLIGRAIQLMPFMPDAHNHLGAALKGLGKLSAAVASFKRALELKPDHAGAHDNLGSALLRLGDPAAAEASHRKALEFAPGAPTLENNLANALIAQGRQAEAVAILERVIRAAPELGEAYGNLGNALMAMGRWADARAALEKGVALRPRDWSGWNNYGNVLQALGRHDEAVAAFRRSLDIRPENPEGHSNIIFTLDLMAEVSGEAALAERRAWAARHTAKIPRLPPAAVDADPDRRLRVGYVSADFRDHSAAKTFGPVLFGHDKRAVEVVCYSGVVAGDGETEKFRSAAALWRDTAALDDEALARLIQADRIDILVDLSGHSGGNRLPVFARKPAPVQITAWGHALGTGLDAMDAILLDPVVAPLEHQGHFAERIVHLPALICCALPTDAPEVAPLPALARGYPTLGFFNRASKITPAALALWAAILNAVPAARLVLKDGSFDDPSHRARILAAFAAKGVGAERVAFKGWTTRRDHLAAYADIDLLLDPLPHGGGISALEALWMGVPAIAGLGKRVQSRGVAAFLAALGLDRFIGATDDAYVAAAVAALSDLPALARLRGDLRARLAASPLGNPALYVPAVEAAYRKLWRDWCADQARRA